jgi:uncharacterized membrane protein YgdD (TMEM256/DUF423 family)
MRFVLVFAGLSGFLGVVMGAAGRHMLPADDYKAHSALAIAVMIHLVHTAALIGLAALAERRGWPSTAKLGAGLMMLGIVLFPGAVYMGLLAGFGGGLAPAGGVALMLSWLALAAFGARWR